MAMAHIVIAEAEFLRAEQEGDRNGRELLANNASGSFKTPQRMFQSAMPFRSSSDDQRTIGHGVGHSRKFAGILQNALRLHRRFRFAKRDFVRIDQSEFEESKVAHGARSRADVQRIARRRKHHSQRIGEGAH